ncbi:unnamed protein product [marine sediment metagenome]|uniref:Fe2OG dioxygenase domain-containing protein n=1 Tax=marine sediment metagenome TaxID=412755 RepID=X1E226_9ZZZZ
MLLNITLNMKTTKSFNDNARFLEKVIPDSTDVYERLKTEVNWVPKIWNGKPLPRLCCHSVQNTSIGNDIANWLINTCKNSLNVNIEISDIFGNYYRDGNDYLPDHSDQYNEWIISLSFGTTRLFRFRNIETRKIETPKFYLKSGDIMIFSPAMNYTHKHGIPKQKQIQEGRINLTVFVKCSKDIITNKFNKENIPKLIHTENKAVVEKEAVNTIVIDKETMNVILDLMSGDNISNYIYM